MIQFALTVILFSYQLFATPIYQESFVASLGFQPANHGSSIVEFPNGELLNCWYAGSREGGRDVKIYCANSSDKGLTWKSHRVVVRDGESAEGAWLANKTVGNVSMYIDEENTLWMFYSAVMIGGWSGSHVDYKTSKDFGRSWSKSKRLISGFGNLPRNKPIRLGVNQFFLPLYHELTNFQGYGCDIHVYGGEIKRNECFDIPGDDHGQPAVILRGNKIFAYLRTKKEKHVLFSIFDRALKAWSHPIPLDLPNPDAAVEVEDDGQGGVLIVYNDTDSGRANLSLAQSDDGIHFKKVWEFENTPKESFSYPAIIRGKDGDFFLSYTYKGRSSIKFIRFNAEWLSQEK